MPNRDCLEAVTPDNMLFYNVGAFGISHSIYKEIPEGHSKILSCTQPLKQCTRLSRRGRVDVAARFVAIPFDVFISSRMMEHRTSSPTAVRCTEHCSTETLGTIDTTVLSSDSAFVW
ncbi:hypothetical protein BaRGS_00001058 [Batillaria attramentaria]|uniref:Uncharacterized protein n=1 Tax=Batillaria attramentaria TaxID=370345 RepID=A0ABD0M7H1_9CAEN